MGKVNVNNSNNNLRIKTQAERWDFLLSGNILIIEGSSGAEKALGILNGQLFNFTDGEVSKYNLSDDFKYSIKMKENKIRKYLYIYGEGNEEKFIFATDEEFEKLKSSDGRHITSYDKHEGAWIEQ